MGDVVIYAFNGQTGVMDGNQEIMENWLIQGEKVQFFKLRLIPKIRIFIPELENWANKVRNYDFDS